MVLERFDVVGLLVLLLGSLMMLAHDAVVEEVTLGLGRTNDDDVKLTLSGNWAWAAEYSIGNFVRSA